MKTFRRWHYLEGGRGLLLLAILLLLLCLHVTGHQVLLQLQLGGANERAERAAECLTTLAGMLTAVVLLHFVHVAQVSLAEQTMHRRLV